MVADLSAGAFVSLVVGVCLLAFAALCLFAGRSVSDGSLRRRVCHFLDTGGAELPPGERVKHVGGFRHGSGGT